MKKVTDEQFLALWARHRSISAIAKELNMNPRNLNTRRRKLESQGHFLPAQTLTSALYYKNARVRATPQRMVAEVSNGYVMVFGDAHFWPNLRTTAFKGFLHLVRRLKPKIVVNNGDAFDGASNSRYPRMGWDVKPTVAEEVKACEDRLGEIEEAADGARLVWNKGNHDMRYEMFLAAAAPQYENVKGFSLSDKFPKWEMAWSLWINDDIVVKHRWKGGVHATHNNTVNAGKTIVTNHLHSGKVTPYSDYNGTRWGMDTGTLACPLGPQFSDYLEDNPTNWRSSFGVLRFQDGALLWPQLVTVCGPNHIEYLGEVIDVSKE